MIFDYTPKGVCSKKMRVTLDDQNVIEKVEVLGGCSGNLQGISSLVVGMSAEEAILQMNLLDHSFFLFRRENDNALCIVYARKNGGYGLISDDAE